MRSIKNIIALLIGLCIAFILVEVGLRLFPSRLTGFGTTIGYQYDPGTGVILYPNQRDARFSRRCFSNDKIRTNAVGFRDDDWSLEKRKLRIAVLGDSYMEALQIPDGEFFFDLLERISNDRVEVMNFGISGYGTLTEYITYNKFVKQYRPDLVLLFFSNTDVVDNSRTLREKPRVRLT
jgi:hypothetical protein